MTTTNEPLRGKELARAAINQILDHPETWYQATWHKCKTQHCFGGWCQILSGQPVADNVQETVPEALGISLEESNWLFAASRTLPHGYNRAKTRLPNL